MSDPAPPSRKQELDLLLEISGIIDTSPDIRNIVGPVLETLASHTRMNYGTLTLLDRNTDEILIESSHGLSQEQARATRYKIGEGITGQVVKTGQPRIIPRTGDDPQFLSKVRQGRKESSSYVCVPILAGTEVLGALGADLPITPASELEEIVRLLKIISSMIAQAVKLRREAQEARRRLEEENLRLRAELRERFRPANIIGNSREMQHVYDQIAQVSKSPTTILIEGETGTGKELVAHALHYNSDRADQPFIRVHCAALPENIIESELFGHEKGAFTGAITERKGRFELAHGGTLFLDEIGEISTTLQVKLLRVLQEREFERVGGMRTIKVNVRLIVATNRDLAAKVQDGSFREDLFYRLHVFPIYVPPLRKRKADIALLADHFLEQYSQSAGKSVRRLSSATIDMLMAYHWPGNVRELENCMEHAILVAEGEVVHPHHLPPTLQTAETTGSVTSGSLKDMVEAYEMDLLRDALKSTRGNIASAARMLESTQRIIGYKVQRYDIDPKRYT